MPIARKTRKESALKSRAEFAEYLAKSYAKRVGEYRAGVCAGDEERWETSVAAALRTRKARDTQNIADWRVRHPGKADPTAREARWWKLNYNAEEEAELASL